MIASGLAAVVPMSAYAAGHWVGAANVGLLNLFDMPSVLTFFVSFILISLWNYLVHLASHKVPLLWRFHKVHHSDHDVDVTTTYRVHPLMQLILSGANVVLVVVLGLNPNAVVVFAAIAVLIDMWHHTSLRLPASIEAMICPYIITPALHRIHHSDYVAETETNFGGDLAIWDRLFGTYLEAPKRRPEDFRYGLTQYPEKRANDLHTLLLAPFGKKRELLSRRFIYEFRP